MQRPQACTYGSRKQLETSCVAPPLIESPPETVSRSCSLTVPSFDSVFSTFDLSSPDIAESFRGEILQRFSNADVVGSSELWPRQMNAERGAFAKPAFDFDATGVSLDDAPDH